MATVIRVKRKRSVDPVDALIISAKRRKENLENTDELGKNEIKALLKFAGTVAKNNENIAKHIRNAIRKDKLEKEYKQHGIDIRTKNRETQVSAAKRSRYHVLSSHRAGQLDALDIAEVINKDVSKEGGKVQSPEEKENDERNVKRTKLLSDDSGHEKIFCLYDVQDSNSKTSIENVQDKSTLPSASDIITCNSIPMRKEKVLITIPPLGKSSSESVYDLCYTNNSETESDYVYDLYYTNSSDFDWHVIEQILTIEALEAGAELEYNGGSDSDEIYEDEDDSNDECNWRNDYPDEDPCFIECNAKGSRFSDDNMYEDYDPLPDYLASSCKIGTRDAEEMSSEDEDVSHLYFNDPVAATHLYPQTSYEPFCRKVQQEACDGAGDSENDSSDDESGS